MRDIEIRLSHGKGLKKLSKVFQKHSPHDPWQLEPAPEGSLLKPIRTGIHTGVAGRISVKDAESPLLVEKRNRSSRPPSMISDAGDGFRAKSNNALWKKSNRRTVTGPLGVSNGRHGWSSSIDLTGDPESELLTPLSLMEDGTDTHIANTGLHSVFSSSPFDSPEPVSEEMKDAMKRRSFITVQAQNRGELRRLKAFRKKQLLALATLHEVERNKTISMYEQQQELIEAKVFILLSLDF